MHKKTFTAWALAAALTFSACSRQATSTAPTNAAQPNQLTQPANQPVPLSNGQPGATATVVPPAPPVVPTPVPVQPVPPAVVPAPRTHVRTHTPHRYRVDPSSGREVADDSVGPTYRGPHTVVRERSKKKSAMIIGGSAAGAAAIGALAGGGKGAGIGAIIGGVGGLIYDRKTHKKTEVVP